MMNDYMENIYFEMTAGSLELQKGSNVYSNHKRLKRKGL